MRPRTPIGGRLAALAVLAVSAPLAVSALGAGEPPPARKLVVVCTLPTLEALAREVGGDRVETVSLAKGDQDPHNVSPTPVLMQRTREADLFVELGMSLELWADQVVAGSGNPSIATGTPGRVVASAGVPPLEVPSEISRAQGDIHPNGNPHEWLDPVRAKMLAANIEKGLERKDPAGREVYAARLKAFQERIDRALYGEELVKAVGSRLLDRLALQGRLWPFLEAESFEGKKLSALAGGWLKAALPLRGARAFEYHKVWTYFARLFGIDLRGTIEERPGIPPGPQHIAEITRQIRDEKVRLILVDNFYDPALPSKIASETDARAVVLPNQVRGDPGIETYFQLIDRVIADLAKTGEEVRR